MTHAGHRYKRPAMVHNRMTQTGHRHKTYGRQDLGTTHHWHHDWHRNLRHYRTKSRRSDSKRHHIGYSATSQEGVHHKTDPNKSSYFTKKLHPAEKKVELTNVRVKKTQGETKV